MDNFIDKLAQKFTATDQVKASTYTETKEIAKLKEKIEGYESLLQDMRKLNLKNVASADALNELAESSANTVKQAEEAVKQAKEVVELASGNGGAGKEYIDEMFEKTSDVIHKENVKVYRNVQATVQASLDDQTKAIIDAQAANSKKNSTTFLKVMSVLIFIAVLADIALKVLNMFHII